MRPRHCHKEARADSAVRIPIGARHLTSVLRIRTFMLYTVSDGLGPSP